MNGAAGMKTMAEEVIVTWQGTACQLVSQGSLRGSDLAL